MLIVTLISCFLIAAQQPLNASMSSFRPIRDSSESQPSALLSLSPLVARPQALNLTLEAPMILRIKKLEEEMVKLQLTLFILTESISQTTESQKRSISMLQEIQSNLANFLKRFKRKKFGCVDSPPQEEPFLEESIASQIPREQNTSTATASPIQIITPPLEDPLEVYDFTEEELTALLSKE